MAIVQQMEHVNVIVVTMEVIVQVSNQSFHLMFFFNDIEIFIIYDQSTVNHLQHAKDQATVRHLEHVNAIVIIMEVIVQVSISLTLEFDFKKIHYDF